MITNSNAEVSRAYQIVSAIPGRVRVQLPRQRGIGRALEQIATRLRRCKPVLSTRVAADALSVIVLFDRDRQSLDPFLDDIQTALRDCLVVTCRRPAKSQVRHGQIETIRDVGASSLGAPRSLLLPTLAVGISIVSVAPPVLMGAAMLLAALPIAVRAVKGLIRRRANVEQLDTAALIVLAILGDYLTGSLIVWLVALGEWIRNQTTRRSRRAISEMMSPALQRAWVERDGELISRSVQELKPGDTIVVYPGDQIPVDGVIKRGKGLVDVSVLTGEAMPAIKAAGDAVPALSCLIDGQLAVEVRHIGKDTRAGKLAAMIDNAPLSDTRIQNYAAIVGERLVLPILGLALLTYLITRDLLRVAAILILDFATGIRVAAPTTILSAMTGAARQGLFIKGGRALERLAAVNAVVFDKTGTLTAGAPYVTQIHSLAPGYSVLDIACLAASAEANLKHPSAKAVVNAALDRGLGIKPSSSMKYTIGMGVEAEIDGVVVRAGSERYMQVNGVDTAASAALAEIHSRSGDSLVYVSANGDLIGLLAYADPIRAESGLLLGALRARGVEEIVMLTGDNARAARSVAEQLGITHFISDVYPEKKADVVDSLRQRGYTVAVIGDGINDSPAFARADVGISFAHGADVAKETADVVLLDGGLLGVPRAIDLARGALRILNQNLNVIVAPTAGGLAASVFGLVSPLVSTIISNGATVVAGLNAMRPLYYRGSPDLLEPRPANPKRR